MDDEELNEGILPDNENEEDEDSLSEMGFHKVEDQDGFGEPEKDF